MSRSSSSSALDTLETPAIRLQGLRLEFPSELPVSRKAEDIARALEENQVVIVAGATGSGKTTQLPKIALKVAAESVAQQATAQKKRRQLVGVTQPRRIAATSVAARVATELACELGQHVGYQIRFENKSSDDTLLKFMTDGILLAQIQGDPLLKRYHTLIIDEAHERSLNIDFLLGWLKQILPKRRDLKVIISSATIETQRFSEFFGGAPVIEVEGRTFPVDLLYEPLDPKLEPREAVANAVENIASLDPDGDLLVFLPGEREIADVERLLLGRKLKRTEVLPLYGRLSSAEQGRVFNPGHQRRVILATNVAETSLTLPGIVYVIDAGVARLSRYEPRTGITRLHIEAISQASANQRKGRAGRVRDGICVRLYDEQDFETRPAFTDPEVRRVGLAGVILQMKASRLGDVESFPFLDAPEPRSITEGYRVLEELGALTKDKDLTDLGKRLARFPIDPRIARMILAGADHGCLEDVLILAAALEIRDPRERPRAEAQKADQLHRRFHDATSDFSSLLKLWDFISQAQSKGSSHLRRTCKQNYLSHARVREWREVHRQLRGVVKDLRLGAMDGKGRRPPRASQAPSSKSQEITASDAVHMALLTGMLSRIGQYIAKQRGYLGARQTQFALHPASGIAKKPPAWVMAFELVETSRLFGRCAAKIEPEWIDKVAGHLLKRSYSAPHWSEKSARASVRENATLYGLPVLKERRVDYASIEPGRARLMFLEHALVRGEYTSPGPQRPGHFQDKNRELLEEVARLRDKARQSSMLADDDALLDFFDQKVPASVVNGKTFETWRKKAEQKDPNCLKFTLDDVLKEEHALHPEDYPDELELCGANLPLSYLFEPRAENDGVTLTLPLALVPRLEPEALDWTIPAWHQKRIYELLERLPKAQKRQLGNLKELAAAVAPKLTPFEGPFIVGLVRAIQEHSGVSIPPETLRTDLLPGYLRLVVRVCNDAGKLLGESRDIPALLTEHGAKARQQLQRQTGQAKARRLSTSWDFGELPEVTRRVVLGTELDVYPALLDQTTGVELTVEESSERAFQVSKAGVHRLCALALSRPLKALAKRIGSPFRLTAGLPPKPSVVASFQDIVLQRIVREAFPLSEPAALPRSQTAFEAFLAQGSPRLETAASLVLQAIAAAALELEPTVRALDNAAKQRAGTAAIEEMRSQLKHLFPPELLSEVDLEQLYHFPRYLKAIRVRLERATNNPQKDADKLEPLAPLWEAFLAKWGAVKNTRKARLVRWDFEELRVALFAPELKPAYPVNLESVKSRVEML